MFDLSEKLALVTGAGQGIGAGIAFHLAKQGATVLVNDYVAERAEQVAGNITNDGFDARALPFDVTDREAVLAAVGDQAIDIIVNNAGNAGAQPMHATVFRDMKPEQWSASIDYTA